MYTQTSTGDKRFSSVAELLHWIATGPILQSPAPQVLPNATDAPITTPHFSPATVQYVPTRTTLATGPAPTSRSPDVPNSAPTRSSIQRGTNGNSLPPRTAREKTARNDATLQNDNGKTAIVQKEHEGTKQRVSPRLLAARKELMRDEQVSPPEKQRVSGRPGLRASAHLASLNASPFVAVPPLIPPPGFENMTVDEDIKRFRLLVEELERLDPSDDILYPAGSPTAPLPPDDEDDPSMFSCFSATPAAQHGNLTRALPKNELAPVFPTGPLNLNPDGFTINYRKSHSGPHAKYWVNADGKEIERLFVTGTIKPVLFVDVPNDKVITYVNPVCVEKIYDDGTVKFRTRLTIGGDRIQYPYDTSAVIAEMEAI
jgi:hypothetical protein